MNDPYSVLGVARDASDDVIKSAYRKLAMQHHPDRNPGDKAAEEKFKEISTAYDRIKDAAARANEAQAQAQAQSRHDFRGAHFDFGFGSQNGPIFTVFDEIFGDHPRARRMRKNEDIAVQQTITLEDAFAGTQVEIEIRSATGTARRVVVQVPKGIDNGSRLRVTGAGDTSIPGVSPGDLYVIIQTQPHERFARVSQNLLLDIETDVFSAILGGEVEVLLIDGQTVRVTIPPGTQPGQRLRLNGHGMPVIQTGIRGDLILTVGVTIPANASPEQRTAVEAARDSFKPAA